MTEWDAASDAVRADGASPRTLEAYYAVLARLQNAGADFRGFDGRLGDGEVALRHDVVLSLERALATARVEAAVGVTGTYFVLATGPVYDVASSRSRQVLRRITALDHDVGLLFDPHGRWRDPPLATAVVDAVEADRRTLCAVTAPVETVAVLGGPDWAVGERVEGLHHADDPRYVENVTIYSDVTGPWPDYHDSTREETADGEGDVGPAQLVVHPGLWGGTDLALADALARAKRESTTTLDDFVARVGRSLRTR